MIDILQGVLQLSVVYIVYMPAFLSFVLFVMPVFLAWITYKAFTDFYEYSVNTFTEIYLQLFSVCYIA